MSKNSVIIGVVFVLLISLLNSNDVILANASSNNVEYIIFGSYEQDNNLENGYEPIIWRILHKDDSKVLLLSNDIIGFEKIPKGTKYSWSSSPTRKWCNDFYADKKVFSNYEKSLIMETQLQTENANLEIENTKDYIFLLNKDEMTNEKYGFKSDKDRLCEISKYLEETIVCGNNIPSNGGLYTNQNYFSYHTASYWLRSGFMGTNNTYNIDLCGTDDGKRYFTANPTLVTSGCGIRPACYIDLSKVGSLVGDGTLENPYNVSQEKTPSKENNSDENTNTILSLNQPEYLINQSIKINWNKIDGATKYNLIIEGTTYKDNENGVAYKGYENDITIERHQITLAHPGSYTIHGIAYDNNGKELLVFPKVNFEVKNIIFEQKSETIVKGSQKKLTPSLAENTIPKLSWSSSEPSIVSVDRNGNIQGLQTGTAEITANITGRENFKAYKTSVKVTVLNNVIFPVDATLGPWTALTYTYIDLNSKTLGHVGTDKRAIDLNLNWPKHDSDKGVEVRAVADGTVVKIVNSHGQVHIKHTTPLVLTNGKIYNEWYTVSAHMGNITLKEGTEVKQGDIIGHISNVGAGNNHLHFAITTKLAEKYNISTSTSYEQYTISPYWLPGVYSDDSIKCTDAKDTNGEYKLSAPIPEL